MTTSARAVNLNQVLWPGKLAILSQAHYLQLGMERTALTMARTLLLQQFLSVSWLFDDMARPAVLTPDALSLFLPDARRIE